MGNQISCLREEICHQEDLISKLQKDKKTVGEQRQKTEEDTQAMEDKSNHLSKVKGKLEQSLDEAEDQLEREKKGKGDTEKVTRKYRVISSLLKNQQVTWRECWLI